jgi:hypothetical protein
MFTFDTVVDAGAKNAKQVISYIEQEQIRTDLTTLVDAQVAVTKSVYDASKDMFETVANTVKEYNLTGWDFSKMVAPTKKSK